MHWQPNRTSSLSLIMQIRDWMLTQISSSAWPVQYRLPSQRQLAATLNVNRSTIQEVIEELKADGILYSKIGSGTFVASSSWDLLTKQQQPNWQRYIEAGIHKPNYETIQLINEFEQHDNFIRLSTGELAPSLIPSKQITASLQSLALDGKTLGYSSPQGSLKLRRAICDYVKSRGIDTTPEQICIVSGGLQALQLIALGLLETGSVVFHEKASYLNSVHPFQSFGMQLQTSETLPFLPCMPKHKRAIAYTIPTLNNPTGAVWSLVQREQFYAHCVAEQLPIIEDDVYHELFFDTPYPALKSMDTTNQIVYLGSVSKTLSPGLRIGWVIASPAVVKRLADVKMQMDYGSSAISQEIVAHWLASGLYEQHVKNLRRILQQRAQLMENHLQPFQEIASWQSSRGGFYIWLKFNEPIVTTALFQQLVRRRVLINPGYIYAPHDAYHIRLSYAYASEEELRHGLAILLEEAKLISRK
ncbi:MAG: PLP-dependent aminotransferase family protein [Solibacillus sp.]